MSNSFWYLFFNLFTTEEFKESEKISLNTELIPNNTEIDGEDPENQMRSFSSFFSNPDPPSTSPQDNLFVSNIGHKMLKNMGWTEGLQLFPLFFLAFIHQC